MELRRKSRAVVVLLSLWAGSAAAANTTEIGSLGIAAQACLASGFWECSCVMLDFQCGCKCSKFSMIKTCITNSCSPARQNQVLGLISSTCATATIVTTSSVRKSPSISSVSSQSSVSSSKGTITSRMSVSSTAISNTNPATKSTGSPISKSTSPSQTIINNNATTTLSSNSRTLASQTSPTVRSGSTGAVGFSVLNSQSKGTTLSSPLSGTKASVTSPTSKRSGTTTTYISTSTNLPSQTGSTSSSNSKTPTSQMSSVTVGSITPGTMTGSITGSSGATNTKTGGGLSSTSSTSADGGVFHMSQYGAYNGTAIGTATACWQVSASEMASTRISCAVQANSNPFQASAARLEIGMGIVVMVVTGMWGLRGFGLGLV